jgi:hypothetical protein
MEPKINIGEITIAEYNIIMKQLTVGQLGECIDLFMKMREIGAKAQQAMQAQQETRAVPPPAA